MAPLAFCQESRPRSLHADIDSFSVPCLKFLIKLITLHINLATADKISLSRKEQVERDDGLLKHTSKLKTLESINISQQATAQGIACLAVLPNLESLALRLSHMYVVRRPTALDIWEVQRLFQTNSFHLKHLHFEFMLGDQPAIGRHKFDSSKTSQGLQFWVPG